MVQRTRTGYLTPPAPRYQSQATPAPASVWMKAGCDFPRREVSPEPKAPTPLLGIRSGSALTADLIPRMKPR